MIHSFKVTSTLAAYRCVSLVTGTGQTVEYPDTITAFIVGITKDTVKDTVNAIPVAGPGEIAKLLFNDTVTAGELVKSDASGRGVPFSIRAATTTAFTVTGCYVGALAGNSVAATGTIAEVLVAPGYVEGT